MKINREALCSEAMGVVKEACRWEGQFISTKEWRVQMLAYSSTSEANRREVRMGSEVMCSEAMGVVKEACSREGQESSNHGNNGGGCQEMQRERMKTFS